MGELVEFFSAAQIDFARVCVECGCPDNLNMSIARLVWMLDD